MAYIHTSSNLVLRGPKHLPIFDDRGFGSGASHVERDHVTEAKAATQMESSHHARRRSRFNAIHRLLGS